MPDLPALQTAGAVALFGALGCLARYWLSGWVYTWLGIYTARHL